MKGDRILNKENIGWFLIKKHVCLEMIPKSKFHWINFRELVFQKNFTG